METPCRNTSSGAHNSVHIDRVRHVGQQVCSVDRIAKGTCKRLDKLSYAQPTNADIVTILGESSKNFKSVCGETLTRRLNLDRTNPFQPQSPPKPPPPPS